MIELNEVFDANKDILLFVQSRSSAGGQNAAHHGDVQLSFLGQEKDGTLLYSWNDWSPYNTENPVVVTQFGLYDPLSSKNKVIFVHEKVVVPVCATINEEKSFLCFTSRELVETDPGEKEKKEKKELFQLFLAEIQPQGRIFSLNIDRHRYLKAQFIYTGHLNHVDSPSKESHLVVQLHKESIGLYHIPFARAGGNVIMCGQPRTEQLHGKFVWSQWDMIAQRLYYVHFRKKKAQDPVYCPVISCLRFESGTSYTAVFEVSLLGIPIPRSSSKTNNSYLMCGLWKCIPDSSFNMEVVTQPNGSMCICLQHPMKEVSRTSAVRTAPPMEEVEYCTLEYSVCIIHHARTLHVKVPNVSRTTLRNTRMFFSSIGDYLLAHLPGVFCHLLNVSIELEPSNHIIYHENTFLYDSSPKLFTPFYNGSAMLALDLTVRKAYKLKISHDALLDLFKDTVTLYTRHSVIHYATVYAKELQFLKKIMEAMCNDPCSPEICSLLKEMLLGSTYSLARKRLDRRIAKLLPFTSGGAFSGHCEKNGQGTRLAMFSYSLFKGGINITEQELDKKHKPHDDLFHNLLYHIRSVQVNAYPRFEPSAVLKEFMDSEQESGDLSSERRKTTQKESKKQSANKHKHKQKSVDLYATQASPMSRCDTILGMKPPFFAHMIDHSLNKSFLLCQSKLKTHVVNCLERDIPEKVEGICMEYSECMLSQCKQLCHLIWSVLGPSSGEDWNDNLSEAGNRRDKDLFHMFETFLLAITELSFPYPPGFQQFFTKLAFRCLDNRLFLQYVDQGVLTIDRAIVEHVIEDLEVHEGTEKIICQLVSRLPSKDARRCLELWNSPAATRNIAQKIVSHCLKDKELPMMAPGEISAMSSVTVGTVNMSVQCSFPPMATLLELLESKDPQVKRSQASRVDRHFLERNALLELHGKCGADLSGVNF